MCGHDHTDVLTHPGPAHGFTAVLPTANGDLAIATRTAKDRAIDILIPGRIPILVKACTLHVLCHVLQRVHQCIDLPKVSAFRTFSINAVLAQTGNTVAVIRCIRRHVFDLDIFAAVINDIVDVTGTGRRAGRTIRAFGGDKDAVRIILVLCTGIQIAASIDPAANFFVNGIPIVVKAYKYLPTTRVALVERELSIDGNLTAERTYGLKRRFRKMAFTNAHAVDPDATIRANVRHVRTLNRPFSHAVFNA